MKQKQLKNWWYYYKWYVIGGAALLGIVLHISGRALGIFEKKPDVQIAYVGEEALPDDTVRAAEEAFSNLAADFNRDGTVWVKLNQYVKNEDSENADAFYYKYASEVTFLSDIEMGESYFILTDDPQALQKDYQILAGQDGSIPGAMDFTVEDKVFQWKDCSLLSEMELGAYTSSFLGKAYSGSNQELLSELYIGHRFFYENRGCENQRECDALWEQLMNCGNTEEVQKEASAQKSELDSSLEDVESNLKGDDSAEEGEASVTDGNLKIGTVLHTGTPQGFALLENKDILAGEGLYYVTWVKGAAVPYENSEGDTVDLYDAQLYLISNECNSEKSAEKSYETWLDGARKNYTVTEENEITCKDHTFTVLSYTYSNPDNPYDHGISAFVQNHMTAVCAELACTEACEEDLTEAFLDFLENLDF